MLWVAVSQVPCQGVANPVSMLVLSKRSSQGSSPLQLASKRGGFARGDVRGYRDMVHSFRAEHRLKWLRLFAHLHKPAVELQAEVRTRPG